MSDCISREMALKECLNIVVDGERYRVVQEETLLGLPPVNPQEPKTGHWIRREGYGIDGYSVEYSCSECNEWVKEKSNYCPNCGARMVELQESEDNNG